jgi:hypothetical protein
LNFLAELTPHFQDDRLHDLLKEKQDKARNKQEKKRIFQSGLASLVVPGKVSACLTSLFCEAFFPDSSGPFETHADKSPSRSATGAAKIPAHGSSFHPV